MNSSVMPDYSVSGASKETVFLLHGLYGAKEYWRSVTARLLKENYRVVAWDAPGYGLGSPQQDYSLMGAARSCARLVAQLGTSRNIIVGQSMGGQIAMRVNKLVPGLLSAIVITSTMGYLGNKSAAERDDFVKSRQTPVAVTEAITDKNLAMVISMMAPGASGPDVEMVKTVGASTPNHAIQAGVKAMQTATDEEAIDALRSISIPSLFIAGEKDKIGSPDGMKRIAEMAAGKFEVIKGSGHYPWAEAPDAFWERFAPFVKGAFSPAA